MQSKLFHLGVFDTPAQTPASGSSILRLLPVQADTVLDAGCGIGCLTPHLAEHAKRVIGVDPSSQSIALAREHFGNHAEFVQSTLEDYALRQPETVDLVVANMVLMDVLNLDSFLAAAANVVRPSGQLVFSMTHPCFWPSYRGYANAPWFRYDQETIIEAPFRITADESCELPSTHVHRPFETYFRAFQRSRFAVEILVEPMPISDVAALYPRPWQYPRYLVGQARVTRTN